MNKRVHFNLRSQLSRRTVLRGTGVALGIPWLTAMHPAFGGEEPNKVKRFVSMTLGLGLVAENLNPKGTGRGYQPSRYLKSIDDLREHFTVISGCSHPGVKGGHRAEASLLSANPGGASGKNSVSVDQLMAKHLGGQTRYPSLVLSSSSSTSPSYTESGAMIPAENSPSRLFAKLFIDDSPAERKRKARRVKQGRSIMDLVGDDAKRLARELGKGDQQRLNSYFESVRDLEVRLSESEAWANRPKPKVKAPRPVDIRNRGDFIGQQRLMSDVIRLALETDSTRFVSYHLGAGGGVVPINGVREGYHGLSHHGRDEDKLDQLALIEQSIVAEWGEFLRGLQGIKEPGGHMLDRTSVLLTSNLGNASNHDNRNMPVLFAGGGFSHGQHLAFDQKRNYPLPNLFVSELQRLGMEVDKFATSTGTFRGLS
ncbi:MAG: DUF1552 domain-containing protein [Planctomycetaceae bacterium]